MGRQFSLVLKELEKGKLGLIRLQFPISNTLFVEVRKNKESFDVKKNIIKLNKKEIVIKNSIESNLYSSAVKAGIEPNVIVEFALNLNVKFKIKNNETKYLLKKVAERYLPNKIIYRHKCGLNSGSKFKFANEKKNREKYQKKYLEYCRSINID